MEATSDEIAVQVSLKMMLEEVLTLDQQLCSLSIHIIALFREAIVQTEANRGSSADAQESFTAIAAKRESLRALLVKREELTAIFVKMTQVIGATDTANDDTSCKSEMVSDLPSLRNPRWCDTMCQ